MAPAAKAPQPQQPYQRASALPVNVASAKEVPRMIAPLRAKLNVAIRLRLLGCFSRAVLTYRLGAPEFAAAPLLFALSWRPMLHRGGRAPQAGRTVVLFRGRFHPTICHQPRAKQHCDRHDDGLRLVLKRIVRSYWGERSCFKPGYYGDGGGLYLQVSKEYGSRDWVFRFMLNGRVREMGLGSPRT